MTRRRYAAALTLFLLLFASVRVLAGEVYGVSSSEIDFYRGNRLMSEWRVDEARELVDAMLGKDPASTEAKLFEAHVLFFEGEYEQSLARLEEVGERGKFHELVKTTYEATKAMKSRESEHFVLFWDNPNDEVLVEAALEGLEAAHATLAERMDFTPTGKVRVEIYPTLADFTAVSTLTREEVETTGIIGLCKFNRLMITSPRATVWGYRWRDTLSHEYLHLLIYRLSRGAAPIWIHEGVAKQLEASWRGQEGKLSPLSLAILSKRHSENTLIALDAMSPSIAKLPSNEDATVAFAQVGTMMHYLAQQRGPDAPVRLVAAMGAGLDDRAALEKIWGGSFVDFERSWKGWVGELPLRNRELEVIGIALKDGYGGENHSESTSDDEPGKISDPKARDFVRLGDMLRTRGRDVAALAEYGKAYVISPRMPAVASRYAGAQLRQGHPQEALDALEGVLDLYEDRGVLWFKKGEALAGLERHEEATAAFEELMEINPFDLPGRMGLLDAAQKAGNDELVNRQHRALGILGALSPGEPDDTHGVERNVEDDQR
jgi:tetratricopeptide (TPR) repeat protein